MIWTYPGEPVTLATLHDVIEHTERELLLATYELTGLTEQPGLLISPLAQAMEQRQLDVSILVRSRNNIACPCGTARMADRPAAGQGLRRRTQPSRFLPRGHRPRCAPLTRSGRKIVCACARRDGTMSYALGARDRS